MTDVFATTAELMRKFVRGELDPRAHLEGLLNRIERLDPKLHAFVTVYADSARAGADAAAAALARGYPIGPMTGVPFALKDIVDVAGHETAGGSEALAGRIPARNAVIADRLTAAGGVLLGKTHTVEVAMGGWGTNRRLGTPVNPWDLGVHRTPGGSSSGSGVSVAAGLVPFAIGTDTGGSVRLPSAWNGIVGLKVTEGTIPVDGIIALSHTLDTPGPMARSVEDCALGFEVLHGREPRVVLDELLNGTGLFAELSRGVTGMVVGAMPDAERGGIDAQVLSAYDASLEQLKTRGAIVKSTALPKAFEDYREGTGTIIAAEGYFHHGTMYSDAQAKIDEDVRPRIMSGEHLSATAYLDALRGRIDDRTAFLDALEGFDVLLTPTVATPAVPIDEIDQGGTPAGLTRTANYLGLCAATVPNGRTAQGLPTALQIIGRPHAEATVLRIAADLQSAAGGRFASPDL